MFQPIFPTQNLLADAEVVEDVGEDLVGGYIAHDVGKVVDTFAKVL